MALFVALCPVLPLWAQPTTPDAGTPAQSPASTRTDIQKDLATLIDASQAADARKRASSALARVTQPEHITLIAQSILFSEPADWASAQLLLSELALVPSISKAWLEPLMQALTQSSTTPEQQVAIIQSLSSMRTRGAVRLLIDQLSEPVDPTIRSTSHAALVRLTGVRHVVPDYQAWNTWFAVSDHLPELQWQQLLITNLATEADESARLVRALREDLIQTSRALYRQTEPDQRSSLLASMLLSNHLVLRDLGYELIYRELSAAQRPGEQVAATATQLLTHKSARERIRAARLIHRLAPPDASEPLAIALRNEKNAEAAAAQLAAIARWPDAIPLDTSLNWLSTETLAQDPASQAVLELFKAGRLDQPPDQTRVLEALRKKPVASLTPAAATLLITLGTLEDRQACQILLKSADRQLKIAAALALSHDQSFTLALLDAADQDALLIVAAAASVARFAPTSDNYLFLQSLALAAEPVATSALDVVIAALPPSQKVIVASHQDTPVDQQLRVLESLNALDFSTLSPTERASSVLGLHQLAELHLQQSDPEKALLTLSALNEVASETHNELRCVALVMLERFDEAQKAACDTNAWFRALELQSDQARKTAIALKIDQLFKASLNEAQQAIVALYIKQDPPAPQVDDRKGS